MRKFLFSMAAVSALTIGAPAAAQFGNGNYQDRGYGNGRGIEVRADQLQARLEAGIRSGAISRQEANRLSVQLRQLNQLEWQYSRGGLSARERQDLQMRVRNLREQIRYAEARGNAGYGNQDRYGGYDDRYERQGRIDRDRDGYDDRDYNRDGRWNDQDRGGYGDRDYDRDDRWDDHAQDGYRQPSQGGLGGILGSIFGGNTGLRVGQRVSAGLYGLPYEYRRQFQDGNGVYYRTDGRNIYQIDARTQTVVRIYQMNR